MLQTLYVKNLALIDEMEIELKDGLNILTGETGAGKSIIIDSISFALGEKVDKHLLREKAGAQPMIEEAPVVIVMCSTPDTAHDDLMPCGEVKHPIDTALSGAYMMLEAYDQGLGTCWLGAFNAEAVKEVLGIPDEVKVVTMIPLGYHDGTQERKTRKPLHDSLCFDHYS